MQARSGELGNSVGVHVPLPGRHIVRVVDAIGNLLDIDERCREYRVAQFAGFGCLEPVADILLFLPEYGCRRSESGRTAVGEGVGDDEAIDATNERFE